MVNRSPSLRSAILKTAACMALGAALGAAVAGCTPADRAAAGGLVKAGSGFVCAGVVALVSHYEPNASTGLIGTFCADAMGAIGSGLQLSAAPTTADVGSLSGVEPTAAPTVKARLELRPFAQAPKCASGRPAIPLASLLPGRDAREQVCPEYSAAIVRRLVLATTPTK